MKLKFRVDGEEKEYIVDASIPKAGDAFKDLSSTELYSVDTGLGRIQVGGISLVFVEDAETKLRFPIVLEKGKNARMVLDMVVRDGEFYLKTSINQSKSEYLKISSKAIEAEQTAVHAVWETGDKAEPEFAVAAALGVAQTKFAEIYGDAHPENANNLSILYRNNTKAFGKYQSFIRKFIPVKNGDIEATIIVAPASTTDDTRFFAYYVPKKLERSSCLIDKNNFDSLGAIQIQTITNVPTDVKKMNISFATGEPITGVEYLGSSATIIEELNNFYGTNASSYERNAVPVPDGPKPVSTGVILGGVNATHRQFVKKFSFKRTTVNDCFFVAPHVANPDNKAVYVAHGVTIEQLQALNLSENEFLSLIRREDVNDAKFVADGDKVLINGKDVTGIDVVGIKRLYSKSGETTVRAMNHKRNLVTFNLNMVRPERKYELVGSKDLAADLSASAGWDVSDFVRSPSIAKIHAAVKHGLTAVAVGVTILAATLAPAVAKAADQKAFDDKVENAITYVTNAAQDKRDLALANLPDESDKAVEKGMEFIFNRAKDIVTVGDQYANGNWDVNGISTLIDTDIPFYTQTEGLKYNVPILASTENGNIVYGEKEMTLTQEEVEAFGKNYIYSQATMEGIASASGSAVADDCLDANKPVLKREATGETSVKVTYEMDSREKMVAKYEAKYKDVLGEGCGELLVSIYENAFEDRVREVEKDGSIGSNDVENVKDIYESIEVKDALASKFGQGTKVLTIVDGYLYAQSADKEFVVKVKVSNDVNNLANDIEEAEKKDVERYVTAVSRLENVFPGANFGESKYANTYVHAEKYSDRGITELRALSFDVKSLGDVFEGIKFHKPGNFVAAPTEAGGEYAGFNEDIAILMSLDEEGSNVADGYIVSSDSILGDKNFCVLRDKNGTPNIYAIEFKEGYVDKWGEGDRQR